MNKEERIRRYGETAYEKKIQQNRDWCVKHREEHNAQSRKRHAKHRDIDVIQILEGEITLLTEEEIRIRGAISNEHKRVG